MRRGLATPSGRSRCTISADSAVKVEVSFWGVTRRLAGTDRREISLADGADVEALIDALEGDAGLAGELERCAFAVGTTLVPRNHSLSDGDEVAVLPPVSGG